MVEIVNEESLTQLFTINDKRKTFLYPIDFEEHLMHAFANGLRVLLLFLILVLHSIVHIHCISMFQPLKDVSFVYGVLFLLPGHAHEHEII